MPGHSQLLPPGDLRAALRRSMRALVAVPYRQAGLLAAWVLVGAAASLVLSPRTPRHPAAVASAQAASAVPASRLSVASDPVGGSLKLDLSPDVARTDDRASSLMATLTARTRELPLRLDEARQLAQESTAEFQRKLDQVDLSLHLPPPGAGTRATVAAPDRPGAATVGETGGVRLSGPLAGLLLGLLLAARRELRGDRMRSAREAERALGLPVLGAIPTLSARARDACVALPCRSPEIA